MAGLTGITTDYLYQIGRGKKLPALPVARQLANVLRVPLATLLGETSTSSCNGTARSRRCPPPGADLAPAAR